MYSFDKANFKNYLKKFPDQISESRNIFNQSKIRIHPDSTTSILYLGMGGSAIAGDILHDILFGQLAIPMQVVRGYECPGYCGKKTLVIASSYSGNTEETLSSVGQAEKRGAKIVAVTSGGELAKTAKKKQWKLIKLPSGFPPRQAFGYLFFPVLHLLKKLADNSDMDQQLDNLTKHVCSQIQRSDELSAEGKSLPRQVAFKLHNKIPIIYSVEPYFKSVAFRWRTQFNENAKSLAFHHALPEMNHNEIVGWEMDRRMVKDLIVLFLESEFYSRRLQTRIQLTKKILNDKGIEVIEIYGEGQSLLEQAISLVCTGDWISYYLALLYEKDPLAILNIDYFKSELKKLK